MFFKLSKVISALAVITAKLPKLHSQDRIMTSISPKVIDLTSLPALMLGSAFFA
jgi:hypothetical protein